MVGPAASTSPSSMAVILHGAKHKIYSGTKANAMAAWDQQHRPYLVAVFDSLCSTECGARELELVVIPPGQLDVPEIGTQYGSSNPRILALTYRNKGLPCS
jgi:hypothetical protein